jgi:hypothetical protein
MFDNPIPAVTGNDDDYGFASQSCFSPCLRASVVEVGFPAIFRLRAMSAITAISHHTQPVTAVTAPVPTLQLNLPFRRHYEHRRRGKNC